jgi:hypothetical protein
MRAAGGAAALGGLAVAVLGGGAALIVGIVVAAVWIYTTPAVPVAPDPVAPDPVAPVAVTAELRRDDTGVEITAGIPLAARPPQAGVVGVKRQEAWKRR